MWGWTNLFHIFQSKSTSVDEELIDTEYDEIGHYENACCGPGYCCLCGDTLESDDLEDETP